VQQLLWIETLLKLTGGLVLAIAPMSAVKLFGLPQTGTSFWPRLLGAVLIGLAGAMFLEARVAGSHGLGLAGCAVVNLTGAAMMAALLVTDAGPPSVRGRGLLWLLVILLAALSILELASL
jgi:hypothetical protein